MGSNVHHLRSSDGLSVCIGAAFTQEEEEGQEGPISNAAPLRVGMGGRKVQNLERLRSSLGAFGFKEASLTNIFMYDRLYCERITMYVI